jgi:hypothetical protein
MADFFCDISAIGNEYQAYADTPTTWGVPQDGNGKAGPGHAAAVAIATIDVTGKSASGTGTIGVLGVTVSSTLNASGSALATAIANAINASTTAVSATYSALGRPLNRLVFARVDPGLNTRVQIMLRVAGADWNGMAPTQANISPAATISAFSGGANGPFAYLWNFNSAAFGLTGGDNAVPNYGIMTAKSQGIDDPTLTDPIHVRTRRAGSNLTLTHSSTAQVLGFICPSGASRSVIFDDGTIWTGDDGQFFIDTLNTAGSGGSSFSIRGHLRLVARKKYGFRWRHEGRVNGSLAFASSASVESWFENLHFEENPAATNVKGFGLATGILGGSSGLTTHIERGCRWTNKLPSTFSGSNGSGGAGKLRFIDGLFEFTAGVSGIVPWPTAGTAITIEFSRCKFKDINGLADPVLTAAVSGATVRQNTRIVFDQCEGVAPFTVTSTWGTGIEATVIWREPGEDNAHRVECGDFVSEWRPDANIPTLNSLLLSGTPWAYKVMLKEAFGLMMVRRPLNLAAKYRSATAIKNVDVEILVPSAETFDTSMLGIEVEYTDENDVVRLETGVTGMLERVLGTAPTISDSVASWTLNGLTGYLAKRLRLTTQYPIKSGTWVAVSVVSVGSLPGASNSTIYVEPMPVFS